MEGTARSPVRYTLPQRITRRVAMARRTPAPISRKTVAVVSPTGTSGDLGAHFEAADPRTRQARAEALSRREALAEVGKDPNLASLLASGR